MAGMIPHGREGAAKVPLAPLRLARYPARLQPALQPMLAMTDSDSEARVLDVCGLNCPMPLLKAKKALNDMAPGALLKVLATDPGSVRDFEVFSKQSGNELLVSERDHDRYVYVLRKKAG